MTTVLVLCTVGFVSAQINKIDYKKSVVENANQLKMLDSRLQLIPQSIFKVQEKTYAAGNFYIDTYEMTNSFYNAFLKDLQTNKLTDLYEKYKVDAQQWVKLSEAFETASKYYHTDSKYNEYPVVNISKEAANAFCEWLTCLYNNWPQAKHSGARFCLPTESEWLVAAAGGNELAIYPWEGKFLRDKKGELMANFKVAGEENIRLNADGKVEILDDNVIYRTTLMPKNSFTPNKYGIYQMSGNASEMTEDDKIKGGSWHSYGYYMLISAEQEPELYPTPNPFTGFRVVMKMQK